ncbi:MAG: trimeric intracellular cation channel family protein [Sphingobacteriales bacterium]|jgi:uncharacterized membrane protein YeiH|nr:MAG: trimeric intracellular cation channel family protein [Sphingobacteriales bacterium]
MQLNFLTIIDVLGTFAFAVSGAFAAMDKKLDPLGVIILSFVTAIGGGTVRDLLLGNTPVTWLTNTTTITVILIGAAAALFFGSILKKLPTTLFIFDAVGLGLFTLIGIEKGNLHQLSAGVCIAVGTITACFGGVIRDVLLNNVPLIFKKEIYATACIAGGLVYYLLMQWPLNEMLAKTIAILLIVLIRVVAIKYKFSLPKFYK